MAKPATPRQPRSVCPISIALELLGDAWSLLIVRDLMFKDRRTYNDFLTGGEGIASNILADRLRKLKMRTSSRSGATQKTRVASSIACPARESTWHLSLVELVIWSARHEQTDAPAAIVRSMRADREAFISDVRRRWRGNS